MSHLLLEELIASLGEDAPSGSDLEYDPAFVALEELARGKAEQQFGDTVIAPQEPDWREVFEQAKALAKRTRDLRLAVLLARSGARLHGLATYGQALSLIAGLLETQWASVFPRLEADDNNDPTMRLNALAPLVDGATGLTDLRSATISVGRLPLTVRQVELASGKVDASNGEYVPTQEGIVLAIQAAEAQTPGLINHLREPLSALRRIEAAISAQIGEAQGPDLKPIIVIARWLSVAADQAESGSTATAPTDAADGAPSATAAAKSAAPGTLHTRDDAVRALERVCEWIERNEPTNPAPLLIRRAQRLMGKNFLEIMRDLAPESLAQIENIAGTTGE